MGFLCKGPKIVSTLIYLRYHHHQTTIKPDCALLCGFDDTCYVYKNRIFLLPHHGHLLIRAFSCQACGKKQQSLILLFLSSLRSRSSSPLSQSPMYAANSEKKLISPHFSCGCIVFYEESHNCFDRRQGRRRIANAVPDLPFSDRCYLCLMHNTIFTICTLLRTEYGSPR